MVFLRISLAGKVLQGSARFREAAEAAGKVPQVFFCVCMDCLHLERIVYIWKGLFTFVKVPQGSLRLLKDLLYWEGSARFKNQVLQNPLLGSR